ncbi:MAG: hypothetical protein IJ812_05250 [Schwartzia sp.]|nr:hypothetical protein [Schwartzia sp. (in: firmicutes)]MBR1885794.1 hypothetical protein [Schwartzia sp. (in: firmicutes)]
MATVSFDTEFMLQEQYVEPFFAAMEQNIKNPKPLPKSPYVSRQERERGEQLLRKYYSH